MAAWIFKLDRLGNWCSYYQADGYEYIEIWAEIRLPSTSLKLCEARRCKAFARYAKSGHWGAGGLLSVQMSVSIVKDGYKNGFCPNGGIGVGTLCRSLTRASNCAG